jgi:hypothetical protein
MQRKKHPRDSRKFKRERHRLAMANFQGIKNLINDADTEMNTENKTYFNLMSTLSNLDEDAQVRNYSPQALGRKRNMFLNSLALNDREFSEWVQNRLYRIAYDNKRSMSDFTPKDIEIGLAKWEGILRNGDPGFGKYQSQFTAYKQRFIKVASSILAGEVSGRGSKGVAPHHAPSLSPSGEPVSAGMLKYQGKGGAVDPEMGASLSKGGSGVDPETQITPEEDSVANLIADMEKAIKFKDKQFMGHVEDKLLNNEIDPTQINQAELEKRLDDDFQNLLDSIPSDSIINEQEKEIEEIYGQYKERFLSTASKMLSKTTKKVEKASKKEASKAKAAAGAKAADYEAALSLGMTTFTGQDLESTGMDESHVALMRKNPELYAAGKRMASTIVSMHPELKGSMVKWMGKETSTDEQHPNWEGTDATSKTDVMFDLGDKKVKFKNGKFVRCGPKDKDENCTSKIKMSMKIGDSQLSSGGDKETMSMFNRTLENLRGKDFDLSDPVKLSHRLIADGVDSKEARQRAQAIVDKTKTLEEGFKSMMTFHTYKGNVGHYQKDGPYEKMTDKEFKNTKKLVDDADRFAREVTKHVEEMAQLFPSFVSEMVYVAMTGDGKFKEGSDRQANFLISSDHSGDKVVILPASRDLASKLADSVQLVTRAKSSSVKSKKDPLIEKYLAKGMSKEEAEKKASLESPYRVWQVVRILATRKAQQIISSPEVAAQVLQNSKLISFVMNMKLLTEQEQEEQVEDILLPEEREYLDASTEYAFSSFSNMIKFFGIEFNQVQSTDYNLYNMFAAEQPIDMKSQINNRVDVNNQIGDEIQQSRLQKESFTFYEMRSKLKEIFNL